MLKAKEAGLSFISKGEKTKLLQETVRVGFRMAGGETWRLWIETCEGHGKGTGATQVGQKYRRVP